MKALEDRCFRYSWSRWSVLNGRTDSTPGNGHLLIREPVEELLQGRKVVALQNLPNLHITLGVLFPVPYLQVEEVSDAATRN